MLSYNIRYMETL